MGDCDCDWMGWQKTDSAVHWAPSFGMTFFEFRVHILSVFGYFAVCLFVLTFRGYRIIDNGGEGGGDCYKSPRRLDRNSITHFLINLFKNPKITILLSF